MIPLRDKASAKKGLPLVTVSLIVINTLIFIKQIFLGSALKGLIYKYAVVPVNFLHPKVFNFEHVIASGTSLISALFLHGGWMHLLGNMWYLWIFGDNVEDRMGHFKFLVFYLLCGVFGNLAHIFTNVNSNIPALGASGCISGVLGAYFLLFPGAKILTILPLFVFWTIAEIPAFFFLGIWFLIQFLNGYFDFVLSATKTGFSNVAWWAHIGGFVTGFLLVPFFCKKRIVR